MTRFHSIRRFAAATAACAAVLLSGFAVAPAASAATSPSGASARSEARCTNYNASEAVWEMVTRNNGMEYLAYYTFTGTGAGHRFESVTGWVPLSNGTQSFARTQLRSGTSTSVLVVYADWDGRQWHYVYEWLQMSGGGHFSWAHDGYYCYAS